MRTFSRDEINRTILMRLKGYTVREIASELKCHVNTVYYHLSKFKAYRDRAFIEKLKHELKLFHNLYRDGKTDFIEISRKRLS